MPVVICSYCEYVGSGEFYSDRIADVEEHEKTCREKDADDEEEDFDDDEEYDSEDDYP